MKRGIAFRLLLALLVGVGMLAFWAGCDADISGTAQENRAPETALSVRDTSLVDNLAGADRLSSTVFVSWSGTDADGFVVSFEVRFYATEEPPAGPEDGWSATARSDSLVLLPIPRGERIADVVFEVRAIDNEGQRDLSPARTVFPIENAPPAIDLNDFDLPPDTTFSIISFAWEAEDPEGPGNLARIEISLNDSTQFTALPADAAFITLVGDVDRNDPAQTETSANVFLGRSFQNTGLQVPNLRLDADNTFYLRAADQTDTTSTLVRFSWFVKKPRGEVLYVNDYRSATALLIQSVHIDFLETYLPDDVEIDTWDISMPVATGSAGNLSRSTSMPPNADPTLRQQLALYRYIYWVSTNATNSIRRNNLPFAASVMDLFFENGGKVMVHVPATAPANPEDNLGNSAILLLPLSDLVVLPDTVRRLQLPTNAGVIPLEPLPGLGVTMPPLISQQFQINTRPYIAEGANVIPLYAGDYQYVTRVGNRTGQWPGPSTVASISADRRVGLFVLPIINEQNQQLLLSGPDGDPEALREAIHLMLESLEFPKR